MCSLNSLGIFPIKLNSKTKFLGAPETAVQWDRNNSISWERLTSQLDFPGRSVSALRGSHVLPPRRSPAVHVAPSAGQCPVLSLRVWRPRAPFPCLWSVWTIWFASSLPKCILGPVT